MQQTVDTGTGAFPALKGHKYICLTTFRKNGEPVPTPVWFAQVGDRLYVVTNPNSGKVKRIRHTPEVEVAPSDGRGKPLGEPAKAVARILSPEEEALARSALDRKYRLAKRLLNLYSTVRRSPEVHLEITPL